KLKRDILDTRAELGKTSAQDQFAKWAKLRRRLDKLVAEYESKAKSITLRRSAFEFSVSYGLRAAMWLIQAYYVMAYRSVPMFYMPGDWFGPVGYFLGWPFAPTGKYLL
ncbi:WRB/Get1 family, partial [Blyttiomyces helicus]